MKKITVIFCLIAVMIFCPSCSQKTDGKIVSKSKNVSDVFNQQIETLPETKLETTIENSKTPDKPIADVDLTELNSTMVYSEVYHIVNEPDKYIGKTIRINGIVEIFEADNKTYYTCIIKDATACCAQGIEFELEDGNYPPQGSNITVYGIFNTYKEDIYIYYQLVDAVIE